MENLLGLLRVRVVRGINLAYRDATGSDPYVVVRMGNQVTSTVLVRLFENYYINLIIHCWTEIED